MGYVNSLKKYISADNLEYINNIDLAESNSISKSDADKISNIIKDAENTRDLKINNNEQER